ncbi:MAG: hypothetical protein WKF96_16315 [Solirubrobacteraceae bacterium]
MSTVEHEVEIEATPEEVWEAIATDEGRQRWLDDDREVLVEVVEKPTRLVWWWAGEDAWSRVEVTLAPAVSATRVVVRETVPTFPLVALASGLARVAA